jgi:hypothetical protein
MQVGTAVCGGGSKLDVGGWVVAHTFGDIDVGEGGQQDEVVVLQPNVDGDGGGAGDGTVGEGWVVKRLIAAVALLLSAVGVQARYLQQGGSSGPLVITAGSTLITGANPNSLLYTNASNQIQSNGNLRFNDQTSIFSDGTGLTMNWLGVVTATNTSNVFGGNGAGLAGVIISTIPNNTPFGGGTARAFLFVNTSTQVAETAAATNGQILIGSTGANPVLASITGTGNQITVTPGAGSITLSAPQNLHTTAQFQVGKLGVGGAAATAASITNLGPLTGGTGDTTNSNYGLNMPEPINTAGLNDVVGFNSNPYTNVGGAFGNIYGGILSFQTASSVTAKRFVGMFSQGNPGTSTVTLEAAYIAQITAGGVSFPGVVTSGYSILIASPSYDGVGGGGTWGSYYGLYVTAPPVATSTSAAIYVESGNVIFNGSNVTTSSVTIKGGGLAVGTNASVATITQIMRGSASLNFGATTGGTCDDLTLTVTGAADGDVVSVGVPNALASSDAAAAFDGFVSAGNTVDVRRCCSKLAGNCTDPAAATVNVIVYH